MIGYTYIYIYTPTPIPTYSPAMSFALHVIIELSCPVPCTCGLEILKKFQSLLPLTLLLKHANGNTSSTTNEMVVTW